MAQEDQTDILPESDTTPEMLLLSAINILSLQLVDLGTDFRGLKEAAQGDQKQESERIVKITEVITDFNRGLAELNRKDFSPVIQAPNVTVNVPSEEVAEDTILKRDHAGRTIQIDEIFSDHTLITRLIRDETGKIKRITVQ